MGQQTAWEDRPRSDLFLLRPGRGVQYCDECVCLFVCLSARITRKPQGRTSPIFMHVACSRGSVFL